MHFDLTNFLSGLTGALIGGLVLWLLSLFRRPELGDRSKRTAGEQLRASMILAAAFVVGVLIALYLLIAGQPK